MWLKQLYNDKLGNMTVKQVLVKTILMFIAAAVSAFGVGLFICSGLGSDPISVWLDGLDHTFHFGIGMASTINKMTPWSSLLKSKTTPLRKSLSIKAALLTSSTGPPTKSYNFLTPP